MSSASSTPRPPSPVLRWPVTHSHMKVTPSRWCGRSQWVSMGSTAMEAGPGGGEGAAGRAGGASSPSRAAAAASSSAGGSGGGAAPGGRCHRMRGSPGRGPPSSRSSGSPAPPTPSVISMAAGRAVGPVAPHGTKKERLASLRASACDPPGRAAGWGHTKAARRTASAPAMLRERMAGARTRPSRCPPTRAATLAARTAAWAWLGGGGEGERGGEDGGGSVVVSPRQPSASGAAAGDGGPVATSGTSSGVGVPPVVTSMATVEGGVEAGRVCGERRRGAARSLEKAKCAAGPGARPRPTPTQFTHPPINSLSSVHTNLPPPRRSWRRRCLVGRSRRLATFFFEVRQLSGERACPCLPFPLGRVEEGAGWG